MYLSVNSTIHLSLFGPSYLSWSITYLFIYLTADLSDSLGLIVKVQKPPAQVHKDTVGLSNVCMLVCTF